MKPHLENRPFFDNGAASRAKKSRKILKRVFGRQLASRLAPYVDIFLPGVSPPIPYRTSGGFYAYRTEGVEITFPAQMQNTQHLAGGYVTWLYEKYRQRRFVDVERGDLVVDCGSFVGGFAISAAGQAGVVYALEPSPKNFATLQNNIENFPNIIPQNVALYSESSRHLLNLSISCVDDSILTPDRFGYGESIWVATQTVDEWAETNGISEIDFFKLEAEGVEIEIIDSIKNINVRKFAIDCSAERNGHSPRNAIHDRLAKNGYEIRERGDMLFAKKQAGKGHA